MAQTGESGGPPTKAGTFLGDDLAGLHGTIAALAALAHRERTGEGQHVDVSLFDALLFQSGGHLLLSALGWRARASFVRGGMAVVRPDALSDTTPGLRAKS